MNTKSPTAPVICYGEVLWDVLPSGPQPGGAPLNVAYHLNKLGINAGIMSRVGDDEDGRKLSDLIRQWGINNSLLQVDQVYPTSRVIATLNANNEVSYEILYPVAWDFLAEDHDLINSINPSTYLVYGSLASRNEVTRTTLFKLLESDAIKVFDINLRPPFIETELLQHLLQKADIVKFNQAELEMVQTFFGGSSSDEASQAAFVTKTFSVKTIIVTKGAEGASCYTDNTAYHSPGTPIEVNDTIGSGDAFLASFVAGLINGDSPTENLKNAIAMGAFVATKKGGCPNYEQPELRHFKNQQLHNQLS